MVIAPLAKAQATETFQPRLITVAEYYRMAEIGILEPDEKLELINGQIIQKMVPQGIPHATAIRRADRLFGRLLGEDFYVHTQFPLHINDLSEPEPDIIVTTADLSIFEERHPIPEDIYLIIEIADSTLKGDLTTKNILYAQANIADYWVLDVKNQKLHVLRQPTNEGYQEITVLDETQAIAPLAFPDVIVPVAAMFKPKV